MSGAVGPRGAGGRVVSLGGPPTGGPFRCYRVADGAFPLLDGAGAARLGGRWNSPGRPVVYASLTYANALLEILAHRNRARVPRGYVWVTLDVPDRTPVAVVDPAGVPGWDAPDEGAARTVGDAWLARGREIALVVPAKPAAPHEWNVAFNVRHPDFGRVAASAPELVGWDARLWR